MAWDEDKRNTSASARSAWEYRKIVVISLYLEVCAYLCEMRALTPSHDPVTEMVPTFGQIIYM